MCEHPVPILVSMSKESKKREGIGYSSSTLTQCPRQYILMQRNNYHERPDDYYARWMGTLGHLAVESSGPYRGVIQEARYHSSIFVNEEEVYISGQPDWYDTETHQLDDYKYTGYPPNSPRDEHEGQVNVYAWLLEKNHLPVHSARVIYLHPKHRQSGKRQTTYHIPLWTNGAVEKYITSRLLPLVMYDNDNNVAKLKIGLGDEWKAQFCPFRHKCNPGRCCSERSAEAP